MLFFIFRAPYSHSPTPSPQFFEGEKGAEHFVRVEYADGAKELLEGEQGAERVVRSEGPGTECEIL